MLMSVGEILRESVGERVSFSVTDEHLTLDDVKLAAPVNGSVNLVRIEQGLAARIEVATALNLECHRCLQEFSFPIELGFEALFAEGVAEDSWPISKEDQIDLAPAIRQELILRSPIQQLCEASCPGLCGECGKRQNIGHKH